MKNQIHLCVDRPIPFDLKPIAAELARKENPANVPTYRHLPGVSANVMKIALETGKLWKNGRTLNVAFLDGSDTQKKNAIAKATMWCKYANVKLNFNGKSKSEIRISLDWSFRHVHSPAPRLEEPAPLLAD